MAVECLHKDGGIGKKFAQESAELAKMFNYYFFGNERKLQFPLITVLPLNVKQIASHRETQTSMQTPFEIILNEKWIKRPRWETAEAMVHELIHVYQELVLEQNLSRDLSYHNRFFVSIGRELGLYIENNGYHTKPADGQFALLMTRFGIQPPEYTIDDLTLTPGTRLRHWWDYDRGIPCGQSTLFKYVCSCPPEKNSVRSGRLDKNIICGDCGSRLRLDSPRRNGNGHITLGVDGGSEATNFEEPSMGIDEQTGRLIDNVRSFFF